MGKIKRKGAYWYPETIKDYDGVWNKDFSMLIVQKAVSQHLINGIPIDDTLRLSADKFDFMKRYKATGGSRVYVGDTQVSKTVRYYVSVKGQKMKKIAPPKGIVGEFKRKHSISDTYFEKIMKEIGPGVWDERIHTKNKSKYAETETAIEKGRLVKVCNNASDFDWSDVDYDYYKTEAEKLLIGEK